MTRFYESVIVCLIGCVLCTYIHIWHVRRTCISNPFHLLALCIHTYIRTLPLSLLLFSYPHLLLRPHTNSFPHLFCPFLSFFTLHTQEGVGGPTLVTDQTLGGNIATKGWMSYPKTNRVVLFDAK